MYHCESCNNFFKERVVKNHYERSGEQLDPPTYHCPQCGGEDNYPVEKCELCGEYIFAGEVYRGVCETCIGRVKEKMKQAIYRDCSVLEVEAARKVIDDVSEVIGC